MAKYVTQTAFRKHAQSVDKRFDAVDKRFDAVDKRFEAVDKRFEAVDKRFDAVDRRFDAFEQRLMDFFGRWATEIDTNIARHVHASEDRIRSEIRGLDDQYRDLPERVAKLEVHTGLKR